MNDVFFIADLHLGHGNLINFKQDDGITPERPFSSIEEMHEVFISNWNGVVKPTDKVYVLGDVVMRRKALELLNRFNGRKSLVRGNHDIFKIEEYLMYFKNVHTQVEKKGIICTHIPIHPNSVDRYGVNVHGHLHRHSLNDKKYFCVSADRINFTPIEFSELTAKIAANYPEWQDRSLAR
jgi:calcineurin-like phosphoesterase family protein